jgi:hypothetical protein
MIDQQLALIEQHRGGKRRREEPRSLQGIPRWSLREPERLVAVAIEAAPASEAGDDAPAIVHCVALRIATGETFQHFVCPPAGRFPSSHHLRYMGLDEELLRTGSTPAGLRAAWGRFVSPDDIVIVWNGGVLAALETAVDLPPRRIQLKSAYRSHEKHVRGPLRGQLERLQLEPRAPAPLRGRAGRHLAEVATLLAHLKAMGERREDEEDRPSA